MSTAAAPKALLKEEQTTIATETKPQCLIRAILDFLAAEDLAQVPDLNVLAATLNLSPSHLRHLLKEQTGISFGRHVKNVRLQKARKLLQETCLSVKEVMISVGMSDHSHFAKDYKKEFGESPTATRWTALANRQIKVCQPPDSKIGHKEGLCAKRSE